ncbi:J domain-containing protein [Halovivax cerinus]|uniref:J domain-containing protein n=1 Tax=Halovivax cerinus TaxID=1487865 RepID=A0ABD5NK22_9EURY|nr:J domain-containing protein [Halovivax cerinus]
MERPSEILGVSPDASIATIRDRYRELLTDHHPDQGGRRERFLEIKRAYEELTGERPPAGTTSRALSAEPIRPDAPTFDAEAVERVTVTPSVTGELLTLSLVGFADSIDVGRLAATPGIGSTLDRPVACFEVFNTGSQACQWRGPSETRFIGTDGFMYEAASLLAPGRSSLPDDWWPGPTTLEPGTGLRAVVVADELQNDATVDRIVYTQRGATAGGSTTERYLFELDREARTRLDPLPFDVESE